MSPTIFSPNYPAPVSNYSQVLGSGDRVVTSRLHMDAKMVEGGTKAEAHQPLENLKAIRETAITNMVHVLKVNIFFTALVGDTTNFLKLSALAARIWLQAVCHITPVAET